MKEILTKIVNFLGLAYWVEIVTQGPQCTYYFGPFLARSEAKIAQSGYVEDLTAEGTREIRVKIIRFKPSDLTIFQDPERVQNFKTIASLRRQLS